MDVKKIFELNGILHGGAGDECRFVLPRKQPVSKFSRVGHGSFFIDERHQILPVGGGSNLASKNTPIPVF